MTTALDELRASFNAVCNRRDDMAALIAELEQKYQRLAMSINLQPGECLPECDSHGHAEKCTFANDAENFMKMSEKLTAAQARITDLEKDAARYRWLRRRVPITIINRIDHACGDYRPEKMDELIDARSSS